jgi:hypothetical protein
MVCLSISMRHTFSFIVTLLVDDDDHEALRGRLRDIRRGEDRLFGSASDLVRVLQAQVQQALAEGDAPRGTTPAAAGTQEHKP